MLVTLDNFEAAIKDVKESPELVVDTETTGLEIFGKDRICGVAIGTAHEHYYFPFRHTSENLPFECLSVLSGAFRAANYIGFNYKFDIHALCADGFPRPSKIEDVLLAAHLANENEPSHALKTLAVKYLNDDSADEEKALLELINNSDFVPNKKKKVNKGLMYLLPASKVEPYACADVILTKQLHDLYVPYLKKWDMFELWQEINCFSLVVSEIESYGLFLDRDYLNHADCDLLDKTKEARLELERLLGPNVNPASPLQLKKLLGTDDVSKETLKNKNKVEPQIAEAIEAFRVISKIKKTYLDKFREKSDEKNVLHCNFNITGTVSGRLSCNSPNLQALPRTESSDSLVSSSRNLVKNAIISRPGKTFIEADFSQLELRIAAHVADSQTMKDIFASGVDFHQATADKMGCTRQIAKGLNFAILYGAGAKKISEMLGLTLKDAETHLQNYFKTFPELKIFATKAQRTAEVRKYLRLFTGRVRHFTGIESHSYKAMNNIIQGSGAEATRLSIQAMAPLLPRFESQIVLTVHDSIIVETVDKNLECVISLMKDAMEKQPWCTVPLKVDIKTGKSLGVLKKYT